MKNLLIIPLFLISYNFCFSSTIEILPKETIQLHCSEYLAQLEFEKINKVINDCISSDAIHLPKTNTLKSNKNLMVALKKFQEYTSIDPALQQEFDKLIASDY
jgi:hypothetical protein